MVARPDTPSTPCIRSDAPTRREDAVGQLDPAGLFSYLPSVMPESESNSPPPRPLRSRAALVVGGSGDIGAAIVAALAEAGWDVTFTFASGESCARDISTRTGAKSVRRDLEAGDRVTSDGPLGALVYCIGTNPADRPVAEIPDTEFRRTIEINLTQAFVTAKSMLPHLIEGRGSIVNVSSIWGFRGVEGIAGYVASKHGLRGLTAVLAREYGPLGITCNEVCPGPVRSAMLERCIRREVGDDPKLIAQYYTDLEQQTPTRRIATPGDVADAVVYLCSDRARSINGVSLVVDGGMTA
jgi:NAD(P)-dependent dehydrogenase (short-subunit alcohol dehydrogenase family)